MTSLTFCVGGPEGGGGGPGVAAIVLVCLLEERCCGCSLRKEPYSMLRFTSVELQVASRVSSQTRRASKC